jgi:hypothetical protein
LRTRRFGKKPYRKYAPQLLWYFRKRSVWKEFQSAYCKDSLCLLIGMIKNTMWFTKHKYNYFYL